MKTVIVASIVVFVLGCASKPLPSSIGECESYGNENKRLNCYVADFRNKILLQLEQDLIAWYQYNGINGWGWEDILIKVELKPDGEIEKLTVIESSNSIRFDDFIFQSIRNASPFTMPADNVDKEKLQSFIWGIKN